MLAPPCRQTRERISRRLRADLFGQPAYKAAVVMKRLNRSAEFVRQLEALRTKYKIKRNFIKLVEQKRKSLYLG